MCRPVLIILFVLLLAAAGCLGQKPAEQPVTALPLASETTTPVTILTPPPAVPSSAPATIPTTLHTATPATVPTPISEATLKARLVDARNQLNNFIESDVADTIITHPAGSQNCEVKKSRELGYLIDTYTGEQTFIRGDYWSINAGLFSNPMRKDHEYIIIHTHPRVWTICPTSAITSLYTFSIGDLEATADLTGRGYHVRTLIAISDKEYRIAPGLKDDWRSSQEIRLAITRIEKRMEAPFSYYDPLLEREFYDVDNLMPLLAKELNYSYSANGVVIT